MKTRVVVETVKVNKHFVVEKELFNQATLYFIFNENKGTDQLRGNRSADLRLGFRISKKQVFS